MSPLDRINQLNNEVALLRSQLSDARKQLESDSATIAKLAKDKRELIAGLHSAFDSCMKKDGRGEAMIGISIFLARFADIPVMEYQKDGHA